MNQYKKVAFYTLGCKLNFSETSTISKLFVDAGFAKVEFEETPDIYVINTCSVTDNADKKCKQLVKKALKINPDAFIAIIGCFAQLKPVEIGEIPGVDLVLGANEKFNLLEHIDSLEKKAKAKVEFEAIKHTKEFIPSYSFGDRTRTFLKVQDGCDYFCSFCTIPLARGRSRSNSIKETLEKAKEAISKGAKEIVLTGVNIGDFGSNSTENFLGLLQELDKLEGVERFRISSIEPNLLTDKIIEFVAKSNKIAPHFHIPLQSGSDVILKSMRRRYDSALYQSRIELIKKLIPNCCIGVDVIAGFPGETEKEFMTTYNFLNELEVSYLHVFTYSERDNTTALRIEDIVPMKTRNERSKMLRILSEKKKRAFYETNLNLNESVLFEKEEQNEMMFGFTSNYVKVKTPYNPYMNNVSAKVKMTEIDRDGVMKFEFVEEKTNVAEILTK